MTSPQACGRAATAPASPSGLRPVQSSRAHRPARSPPPCRAAARMARPIRAGPRAVRATIASPYRDRSARRRGRVAMRHRLHAAPPALPRALQCRRGFQSWDRPAPERIIFRPPRDRRQNDPIAAAPDVPRRCRARPGPDRSRPRTPACIWWRRYPRSAAATCHRPGAPNQSSAAPNKRGRDADSRSETARNGKRVAFTSQHVSLPDLIRQSIL